MRLMIAGLSRETSSFSPVPTPRTYGETLSYGDAAIAHFPNAGTAAGGYLDMVDKAATEITVPVDALAAASGPLNFGIANSSIAELGTLLMALLCRPLQRLLDNHPPGPLRKQDLT